jgi:outer membrane protein with beta-barrel domain
MKTHACLVIMAGVLSCLAATAHAQSTATSSRWSAEAGFGLDNSISGNINSSAIGTIDNQAAVIQKNRYEDVYGTGLHLFFGGGYMLNEVTELKGVFTFQSLDADLTPLGDLGVSKLYAQYDDYQSFGLDVGLRRYMNTFARLQPYADGSIGLAFVDKTKVQLVAPQANLTLDATDFYDKTAAFTFAGNVGMLWEMTPRFGVFGQLGLRYVTGMSEVDQLVGTGLETINDSSARWTVPFVAGIRTRF